VQAIVRAGPDWKKGTFEVAMKTQGEIEAAICEGITRFEQEYMGRGPKDIHAHLIGDLPPCLAAAKAWVAVCTSRPAPWAPTARASPAIRT
jgi:hypothetical protein